MSADIVKGLVYLVVSVLMLLFRSQMTAVDPVSYRTCGSLFAVLALAHLLSAIWTKSS